MIRVATLIALLVPSAALAEPDRLSVLLGTEHVGATRNFNEYNPGLFLTWERQTFDYSIGTFYNSYEDVSVMGAIGYNFEVAPDLELGAFTGIAHYPGEGDQFRVAAGDFVPLLGVQARYRNVFTQLIPADGDTVDAVLTFGLSFSLE